jgi:hypothetical protein
MGGAALAVQMFLKTGVILVIGLAVGFVTGLVVGVQLGAINTHIDFCGDDGSGRYINDPSSRAASCD